MTPEFALIELALRREIEDQKRTIAALRLILDQWNNVPPPGFMPNQSTPERPTRSDTGRRS